jgi:hypothetical protein
MRLRSRFTVLAAAIALITIPLVTSAGWASAQGNPLLAGSPNVRVVCTNGTESSWDTAIKTLIHADTAASVALPSGKVLWAFADTTRIDGMPVFVHSTFLVQSGNCISPRRGPYGSRWQQVPNWRNGDYFWPNALLGQNNTVYIFGEKERPNGNKFPATMASAIASFNATTLTYKKMTVLPTSDVWGGPAPGNYKGTNGYWIVRTHRVKKCSGATDCFIGDTVFIPSGDELSYGRWAIFSGTFPAKDNIGNTVSLLRNGHDYVAFTKKGNAYGSRYIESLIPSGSAGPAGRWKPHMKYPARSPKGTDSYCVQVHPEQSDPHGEVLLTYSVNGISADYHPVFLDVNRDGS